MQPKIYQDVDRAGLKRGEVAWWVNYDNSSRSGESETLKG